MKKVSKEFNVKDKHYETNGLCGILSFNLPLNSGFSHAQFVGDCDPEGNSVIESLIGKKVRVTLEVIE